MILLVAEWQILDVKSCTALADRKWAVDSIQVGKKHKAVRVCGCKTDVVPCCAVRFRTYPLRLVRFQLNSRGLERRGVPGRMGTDLCSETVDGTELTYGRRPDSRTRLIRMERRMQNCQRFQIGFAY